MGFHERNRPLVEGHRIQAVVSPLRGAPVITCSCTIKVTGLVAWKNHLDESEGKRA